MKIMRTEFYMKI